MAFLSVFFHLLLVCLSRYLSLPHILGCDLSFILALLALHQSRTVTSLLSHLLAPQFFYSSSVCPLFTCLLSSHFSDLPYNCLLCFLLLSLTCSSPVPVRPALHLSFVLPFPLSPARFLHLSLGPASLTSLSLLFHSSLTCLAPVPQLPLTCPLPPALSALQGSHVSYFRFRNKLIYYVNGNLRLDISLIRTRRHICGFKVDYANEIHEFDIFYSNKLDTQSTY